MLTIGGDGVTVGTNVTPQLGKRVIQFHLSHFMVGRELEAERRPVKYIEEFSILCIAMYSYNFQLLSRAKITAKEVNISGELEARESS